MSNSSLTLTTLRTRIQNFLVDTGAATFPSDTVDAGIRLALQELSRAACESGATVRANDVIGTLTPTVNQREVSLSTLTGLIDVTRVWFPYESADPTERPNWVDFEIWWNAGTPTLFLDIAGVPDGVDVARIFYRKQHTLNALDSATATTFDAAIEDALLIGAAGHACLARSMDLNETAANMAVSTPNYAALGTRFLRQFRESIMPRSLAFSRRVRRAMVIGYYDPSRLEWV